MRSFLFVRASNVIQNTEMRRVGSAIVIEANNKLIIILVQTSLFRSLDFNDYI